MTDIGPVVTTLIVATLALIGTLYATRTKMPADQLRSLQETLSALSGSNKTLSERLDSEVAERKKLKTELEECKVAIAGEVAILKTELLEAHSYIARYIIKEEKQAHG
jgi:peptidoglycan hydrolase CwlO-like protein